MTKAQFLKSLEERLSGLPREEREERLNFYSEMIEDRMEEGLSEEEAVSAVGSADEIAGQIMEGNTHEKPREGGKLALIIAGSPFWFPILLALAAVAFSVWISLWAIFGAVCGGAVGGLVGSVLIIVGGNVSSGLFLLGCGLICGGLAVFLFFGVREITKGVFWLTKKLFAWCRACFSKKEDAR